MLRRTLLALSLLALAAPASARLVGIGDNDVKFQAQGPLGMKINGSADSLNANEAEGKLTVKVPLTQLKTGIDLRDQHLQKHLETDKYPDATLVVERSALTLPENDKTIEAEATGQFTLHGVTKPMPFKYKAKRTGSDYHVQGRATVDIRQHGIEEPCYAGACVKPHVKIAVKFKLREQS